MSPFTIWSADCLGVAGNTEYPHQAVITDEVSLAQAVAHDYVCAEYRNNYRSNENFISSDCLPMDVDNDHTENPEEWITPDTIRCFFPDTAFAIHYSRHNQLPKNGKSARPRFHVLFALEKTIDFETYKSFKSLLHEIYPWFDGKALDSARFFFGTKDPHVEIIDGGTLNECLEKYYPEWVCTDEDFDADMEQGDFGSPIYEGCRNSTMSHFGGRILKRFGNTDETYQMFLRRASCCEPHLPDGELAQIWQSCLRFHEKIKNQPGYIEPGKYNSSEFADFEESQDKEKSGAEQPATETKSESSAAPQKPVIKPVVWEKPVPIDHIRLPEFPIDALPKAIRDFCVALAKSTQTPLGMAGTAALAILAVSAQGKFEVRAKADWTEPVNLYVIIVMEPSERKSAVANSVVKPLSQFEVEQNTMNAGEIEASKMRKRILERKQKALEDKAAKGNVDMTEINQVADELANYKEKTPLKLYVDDVTTEKLTSVLAQNNGRAAILSTEGGIFDTLAGIYTKNVNIDVMLKGYSGDTIRVDRIGRASESILKPTLTTMLMVQPAVLSGLMQNDTFRGRGLTARFLYCIPESFVGRRKYRSETVPDDVYREYEKLVRNMLEDEYEKDPEYITLSSEADELIEAFAEELEPQLKTTYQEMSDWAGKLVGNVLRIAGLLCRANTFRAHEFLSKTESLVIDRQTMENAISLGKYFTQHALAAYQMMNADSINKDCEYLLKRIKELKLKEFTKRDIMRSCERLKLATRVQESLNRLQEYGYIIPKGKSEQIGAGRPSAEKYVVNPMFLQV